ncbi:MAG: alpha/beta fold hydrolase [Granulosicoccus sp.]
MPIKRFSLLVSLLLVCLFGSFLYGCSTTSSIEKDYPPIGEYITVDELKLHYADTGPIDGGKDKPVIVLLHGASTSLLDFRTNLLGSLSNTHRVLAFDRPGLGYSDRAKAWPNPAEQARLIAKAVNQLGIDQTIWIGHSWAGSVVMAALLNHPAQVSAGVLIAGATHPWDTGVSWHVALSNKPIIGWLFNHLIVPIAGPASIEAAVQEVFDPDPIPDNYFDDTGIKLSLRPKTFGNNAEDVYYLSDWLQEQHPRYNSVSQPLLLITGTSDTVVPSWNHAERLAKVAPAVSWHRLEGAGHAPHHSRPAEVASLISEFLLNGIP